MKRNRGGIKIDSWRGLSYSGLSLKRQSCNWNCFGKMGPSMHPFIWPELEGTFLDSFACQLKTH